MSNSAVFAPFLEQLQAVRNTLLFTPLPRWGIIEAKVTIALLCVSIVTWALELYIRRRKGTWVYRWEGGGYFRPNVQIFIPVSFLLFDSFYIVQMIAVIKRNDDPNKDWIPWFTLFYTAQTVPLILASAAWTWNSLLASKAMSEDQEVDPSKESDDRQVPLLSSKPKLVLLSVIATTVAAIILIFTLGCLCAAHRENAIRDFQALYEILLQAIAGEEVDVGYALRLQQQLEKEGAKLLVYSRRLLGTISCTIFLITIPYIYALIRLFILLSNQRSHLTNAIKRQKELAALESQESTPATRPDVRDTPSRQHRPIPSSSSHPNDAAASDASSEFSHISRPSKAKPVDKNQPALELSSGGIGGTLVRDQKDLVVRMTEWRRNCGVVMLVHGLASFSYVGANVLNFFGLAAAVNDGNDSLRRSASFVLAHVPIWTIIVPQFFGSIALLYDAHHLPARPSPSHPTSNSQSNHGQRRKLTDIELQQHDQNRQRSVFDGSEPIRISVAMSASASENNDDASTVHLSDDKPVVVDLAASTRDGEEPRRETRTMMWNEKQRPSQWTTSR